MKTKMTTPVGEGPMFFGGGYTILDISKRFGRKTKLVYSKIGRIAHERGLSMGDLFSGNSITSQELLSQVKKEDEIKRVSGDIELKFKHEKLGKMTLLISENTMYIFLDPIEELRPISRKVGRKRYIAFKFVFTMLKVAKIEAEERKMNLEISPETLKENIMLEIAKYQFGFEEVEKNQYVLKLSS